MVFTQYGRRRSNPVAGFLAIASLAIVLFGGLAVQLHAESTQSPVHAEAIR